MPLVTIILLLQLCSDLSKDNPTLYRVEDGTLTCNDWDQTQCSYVQRPCQPGELAMVCSYIPPACIYVPQLRSPITTVKPRRAK